MAKHKPSPRYGLINPALLVLEFLLIFCRRIDSITNPQFWAEDGHIFFAEAYNRGGLHSIFMPNAGYFTLLNRVVASIAVNLPLQYAPLIFNLTSGLIMILPVIMINSPRLRYLFPNRLIPALIGLLYVLLPNSSEVSLNLTNSQWHLAVLMFLVVIAKPSHKLFGRVFDLGVLLVGGLTGPQSILLAPFALYRWRKTRTRQSLYNLGVIAATGAAQAVCLTFANHSQRSNELLSASLSGITKILGGKIFVGAILGAQAITAFEAQPAALTMTLLGVALMVYIMAKGPVELKMFNIYSWVILLASLGAIYGPSYNWDSLARPTTWQRYFFVPMLAWLVSLIWACGRIKRQYVRHSAIAVLVCFCALGIVFDFIHPPYQDYHFQQDAKQFSQLPAGTRFSFRLNPAGWSMVLRKK